MTRRLAGIDRHKLEEYLTSVRAIEQQVEQSEQFQLPLAKMAPPEAIPEDYVAHLRLMFDLLAIAFQTDSTRLATFPLAHEGSNRNFPDLGITDGHHNLSHHKNKAENLEN